ncbi:MAG: hypothetical protein EXS36_03550 [Pedosphaera sp.]|nr:hypothetical protein [Pedosphaera sp.]
MLNILTLRLAAKTAETWIYSTSVKVSPGTVKQLGQTSTLSFTVDPARINDEFTVSPTSPALYTTVMILDVPSFLEPLKATLNIGVPDSGDINLNALPDFFEVPRALASATTSGEFRLDNGMEITEGTVSAIWSRPADSTTGTVKIQVNVNGLGSLGTFTHTFEIFEYHGALTYTNAGTNVVASMALERMGGSGTFEGPFNFSNIDANELSFAPSQWKGPGNLNFNVLGSYELGVKDPLTLLRGGLVTNYFGAFFFADGDPATPFEDEYDLWVLQIHDGNDTDKDGLPDLSDPVEGTGPPPKGPLLSLAVSSNGIARLTLTGTAGQKVLVERSETMSSSMWQGVQTATLGVEPITLEFPASTAPSVFWRARVQ